MPGEARAPPSKVAGTLKSANRDGRFVRKDGSAMPPIA